MRGDSVNYANIGLYQASYRPEVRERHVVDVDHGIMDDVRGTIDGTPMGVAVIGFLSLAVLVALNRAGFRFSFGVSAGK